MPVRTALGLLLALFAAVSTSTLQAADSKDRPNLVLIIADDMAWDDCGAYGHPHIKTPNLDKLASEGIRFTNSFSSTPTCTPARAAILTGQSPWNHGMLGYGAVAHTYPFEMPSG